MKTIIGVTKAPKLMRCTEPSCDVWVNRHGFLAVLRADEGQSLICRRCAAKYPKLPELALALEMRFRNFHPQIVHPIDLDATVPEGFVKAIHLGGEYMQWAYQLGLYHGSEAMNEL